LLEGQGASACSMPGKMSKRAPAENSLGAGESAGWGSEVTESAHVMGYCAVLGLRSPIRLARECATTRVDELVSFAYAPTPLAIEPRVDRPPPRPHGEINPPSATRCAR
jgi:hypothetical protein